MRNECFYWYAWWYAEPWNQGKKHSKEFCDNISNRMKGKNHPMWNGIYYHTPYGIFESATQAAINLISRPTILKWCINSDKIITNRNICRSLYLRNLPESPLGKTFREIGFWIINIYS